MNLSIRSKVSSASLSFSADMAKVGGKALVTQYMGEISLRSCGSVSLTGTPPQYACVYIPARLKPDATVFSKSYTPQFSTAAANFWALERSSNLNRAAYSGLEEMHAAMAARCAPADSPPMAILSISIFSSSACSRRYPIAV